MRRAWELHPVFGPGEDRNLTSPVPARRAQYALHPVFGPGEDRNFSPVEAKRIGWPVLHPVFGPGEDRNMFLLSQPDLAHELHPVFGPGEDRNTGTQGHRASPVVAAPGLRTG